MAKFIQIPVTTSDHQIAKSLHKDATTTWSTLTMRTTPFPTDLFQRIHPNHQVLKFYLANLIVRDVANGVQCIQRWRTTFENSNRMYPFLCPDAILDTQSRTPGNCHCVRDNATLNSSISALGTVAMLASSSKFSTVSLSSANSKSSTRS